MIIEDNRCRVDENNNMPVCQSKQYIRTFALGTCIHIKICIFYKAKNHVYFFSVQRNIRGRSEYSIQNGVRVKKENFVRIYTI